MNHYKCYYRGQCLDIHAETTYQAQTEAGKQLGIRFPYEIEVWLYSF